MVIGGTGMLRQLCIDLAGRFNPVTVIARDAARLQSLAAAAAAIRGRINPVAVDYRDTERLQAAVERAASEFGPARLAVCWIHDTAPQALATMAPILARSKGGCTVVHVVGSADDDPTTAAPSHAQMIQRWPALRLQRVTLGFVVESGGSRWLTDAEICSGILAAIDSRAEQSTVGQTRPWSARPGA
jgi:NAD(P)-dependent dehydrogenase (short-subunit alcohol dehydrogenase family)